MRPAIMIPKQARHFKPHLPSFTNTSHYVLFLKLCPAYATTATTYSAERDLEAWAIGRTVGELQALHLGGHRPGRACTSSWLERMQRHAENGILT